MDIAASRGHYYVSACVRISTQKCGATVWLAEKHTEYYAVHRKFEIIRSPDNIEYCRVVVAKRGIIQQAFLSHCFR